MTNKQFFFTYGTDKNFPYQKGYSMVFAEDIKAAAAIFRIVHPNPFNETILNCADYYTYEEFVALYPDGLNFGVGCHEVIHLSITKVGEQS